MRRVEELYDRFGSRLFHYLALKLGSRTDAEDVLQEVLFRLLRYRGRFRFARSPAAFAFQVARNEAARFLTRNGRKPPAGADADGFGMLAAEIFDGPDPVMLERAVGALIRIPEAQREVIVLKIYQGLSFREIATVCGIPADTAASRYRYGLEKLRAELEGKHGRS